MTNTATGSHGRRHGRQMATSIEQAGGALRSAQSHHAEVRRAARGGLNPAADAASAATSPARSARRPARWWADSAACSTRARGRGEETAGGADDAALRTGRDDDRHEHAAVRRAGLVGTGRRRRHRDRRHRHAHRHRLADHTPSAGSSGTARPEPRPVHGAVVRDDPTGRWNALTGGGKAGGLGGIGGRWRLDRRHGWPVRCRRFRPGRAGRPTGRRPLRRRQQQRDPPTRPVAWPPAARRPAPRSWRTSARRRVPRGCPALSEWVPPERAAAAGGRAPTPDSVRGRTVHHRAEGSATGDRPERGGLRGVPR